MKKIISMLLTIILLLTSFCNAELIAFAEVKEYLTLNEPYNISVEEGLKGRKEVYFTCPETGYYNLTTIFHGDFSVYPSLFYVVDDLNGASLLTNIPHVFKMTVDKTYYFGIDFKGAEEDIDLIFTKHEHELIEQRTEPTCATLGKSYQRCKASQCSYTTPTVDIPKTDDHNFIYGVCSRCGVKDNSYQDFLQATLTLGEVSSITTKKDEYAFFFFTPKEDGYYSFKTTSTLSNSQLEFVYYKDGEKEYLRTLYNGNGSIELFANTEFELRVINRRYDGEATINVSVENHVHKIYKSYSSEATCAKEGKTIFKCESCYYEYTETYPKTTDIHQFVNGVCRRCNLEQEGYVKLVREMVDGEEYSLKTVYGGEKLYFTYDAKENEQYDIIVTSPLGNSIYYELSVVDDDGKKYTNVSKLVSTEEHHVFSVPKSKKINIELVGRENSENKLYTISICRHVHDFVSSVTLPTCTNEGYTTYTCNISSCGYSYIDDKVPPTGNHDLTTKVKKPTCSTSGYTEARCKTCDLYYIYDRVPPTGKHSLTTSVEKPTCLTCGYTETMCENCDLYYIYDYVAPNPEAHSFYDGICEYCGVKSSTFTSKELVLDTADNIYTTSSNGAYATFVPQESGYYVFQSYASSSIDSYCMLFDEELNFLDFVDDIISSHDFKCTAYLIKGKTYYLYVDTFEFEPCTVPVKVYKHTHTFSRKTKNATCGEKGYVKYKCTCGSEYYESVTPATNKHFWKVKETVKPNCIDKGYTLEQCSICKETRETNIQPKNDKHEYKNCKCINCDEIEPKGNTVQIDEINEAGTINCHFTEKNQVVSIKFVPSHNGYYLFKTNGYYDTYVEICDKYKYVYSSDDNSGLADNCQIGKYLSAGATYYYLLRVMNSDTADVEVEISEHNHEFVQYKEPAGCGTQGKTTFTCTTCLYNYESEFVPPTCNHNFTDGICTECGKFDDDFESVELNQEGDTTVKSGMVLTFVPKHSCEYEIKSNSNFDVDVILVDEFLQDFEIESCNSEKDFNFVINKKLYAGIKYYIIVKASMNDEFTISASVKHKYTEKIIKPTCTDKGYTEKICDICGDAHRYNYTKALGHKNTVVTTKATTSKNGSKVTKCSVCGEKISSTTIYYSKTITLSSTKYTYDGKVKKPTVKVVDANGKTISASNYTVTYPSGLKNVGKYTVKITFKGNYSGTVSKTFTIVPKTTSISSLSAVSKGFTVKWKKQSTQTTGYQIQIATNSKFTSGVKSYTITKNSTLSKKITKLTAKKKYYVRIRTYKTVNGTKYYSSWSSAKSVTTKK